MTEGNGDHRDRRTNPIGRRKEDLRSFLFPYVVGILAAMSGLIITILTSLAVLELHVVRDYATHDQVKVAIAEYLKNAKDRSELLQDYIDETRNQLLKLETKQDAIEKKVDKISKKIDQNPTWKRFLYVKPK